MFKIKNTVLKVLITLIFLSGLSALTAVEKYALVIGTNYKGNSAGIPALDLCESDAKLMKQKIIKTGNFKSSNVKVLLGRMVTRSNVKKAITGWLAPKVKEGDQVFMYYSGHGTYQRDSAAPNGLRNYLVMFERPHISDDLLNDWLAKVKTKKAIIIFDCCFAGGIAKKGQAARGQGDIPMKEGQEMVVLQDLDGPYFKDKVIVASSDDNETSIEVRGSINHGVFTYNFARAMLNADLNNDNKVTAYEAFFKARNDTIKMAKRFSHKQTPQLAGNASGFIFKGKIDDKPDNNDPVEPDIPDVDDPQDPTDPPITPDEPDNPENKETGTLVIKSNYRLDVTRKNISVFLGDKKQRYRVKWVKHPDWGKVAYMQVRGVKTGVHNVTLKAKNYPDRIIKTGIEENRTTVEEVVASEKGKGAIKGTVWVGNFERPAKNLLVFISPLPNTRQPSVRTNKDGTFTFSDMRPGKYKVWIRGGAGFYTKPYDKKLVIEPDKVTQVDIVLKEFYKKK